MPGRHQASCTWTPYRISHLATASRTFVHGAVDAGPEGWVLVWWAALLVVLVR